MNAPQSKTALFLCLVVRSCGHSLLGALPIPSCPPTSSRSRLA
jgi:hypothetical protein